MPSDPRVAAALAALEQPIAEFRASVQAALAQADAFVAAHAAAPAERAARTAAELGAFADGRIAPDRFSALFPTVAPAAPEAMDALERARAVLRDVSARGVDLFVAEVTDGRRLGATIDDALAAAGAAFGAIIITELVRGGRYEAARHGNLLDALEFRTWNRAERRFAPPLVVLVDGADLHPGALLDFADGREKLVLVVRGAAPPAPLVRCVTPGTFVLQTVDSTGLERIAGVDGPVIAAMMPPGSAAFLHDPAAGDETWQRLTVASLPGAAPSQALGGMSAWQMGQDLKLLAEMARTPFAVPTGQGKASPAIGAGDAVDRLAHWLLDSTGLAAGA